MVGLPGEEKGMADRTIEFWEQTKPDVVMLASMVPYPGTAFARNPERYGLKIKPLAHQKYLQMIGNYGDELENEFVCEYEDWTDEELRDERRRMFEYLAESGMDGAK